LYKYQVILFGLINAFALFQNLINNTLREYLNESVLTYLNDILIFSKTYDEHIQYIRKVLEKLKEKNLPVKLIKYEFHKYKAKFLRYIISSEELASDLNKVKVIQK
jgi:hypothetical protein